MQCYEAKSVTEWDSVDTYIFFWEEEVVCWILLFMFPHAGFSLPSHYKCQSSASWPSKSSKAPRNTRKKIYCKDNVWPLRNAGEWELIVCYFCQIKVTIFHLMDSVMVYFFQFQRSINLICFHTVHTLYLHVPSLHRFCFWAFYLWLYERPRYHAMKKDTWKKKLWKGTKSSQVSIQREYKRRPQWNARSNFTLV